MENIIDATNDFPAWQATIRKGQAAITAMLEAERAALQASLAEDEAQRGKLLREALSLFNIRIPTPDTNRVVLDGIAFSLRFPYTSEQAAPSLIRDKDRYPFEYGYGFDLEVSYALEGKYAEAQLDYETYTMFKTLAIRHLVDDADWTQEHSQLAEAIDDVTRNGKVFMALVDRWEDEPVPLRLPTLSEQLESILREIVRDELMQQDAHSSDYGYEVE